MYSHRIALHPSDQERWYSVIGEVCLFGVRKPWFSISVLPLIRYVTWDKSFTSPTTISPTLKIITAILQGFLEV
jgi:hypothetical protein